MKRSLIAITILTLVLSVSGCTQKIAADSGSENIEIKSTTEEVASIDDISDNHVDSYAYEKPIFREISEGICLSVDPKIEAAYMVIEMVSNETGFNQYDNSSYMNEQMEKFQDFKEHKVFDLAKKMVSKNYSYDAISSSLYYFDDEGNLIEDIIKDQDVVNRAGGMDKLQDFVRELYDFRKISDYDSYFISNSDFYKREMAFAKNYIEISGLYDEYRNHYGKLVGDITIVITPECFCGYGNTVEYPDRIDLKPTLSVIKDEQRYAEFLLHEFSHPYVNPNTEKRMDVVDAKSKLYEPISAVMTDMAYNTWEISLNEHIVRANTAYMIYMIYGEEAKNELIAKEKKRGFVYIEPIYDSIVKYEDNRDKYKDFSQYYDTLMSDIEKIEPIS